MKKILLLAAFALFATGCCSDDDPAPVSQNNVLLLKVDYLTNTFESGKELSFEEPATTFTVTSQYMAPGDFGWIKLFYQEQNQLLFDGGIHWMGTGQIQYPQDFAPASTFEAVVTNDFITPQAGFENVFNPNAEIYDYMPVWSSVQNRVKVRQYLQANPSATVKLFLYTPSVGDGDPQQWDWILILKN